MQDRISTDFTKGLDRDSLPALQPQGTYRYALNSVRQSENSTAFGLTAEGSTQLCFTLPEGFLVRGTAIVEERDQVLLFLYNPLTQASEIGFGHLTECTYTRVIDDTQDFRGHLCFGEEEYIHIELNSIQPCSQLYAYWSVDHTYRYLNLDDPCRLKEKDTRLFRCVCGPVVAAVAGQNGGQGLLAGTYQFFVRLSDQDGNVTNWFDVGQRVRIGSPNNISGELSDESILVTLTDLDPEYNRVEIGVLKTIQGIETLEKITNRPYNTNGLTYTYAGPTGEEETIDPNEVRIKKNGYIKGEGLIQYEGRLLLYNIEDGYNLDMQRAANGIKSKYVIWRVPVEEAKNYPNLMRDETYAFGIVYNYCDGTSSEVFHIPGREAMPSDMADATPEDGKNCTLCDRKVWQVQNTAVRTRVYTDVDIITEILDNTTGKDRDTEYTPEEPYNPFEEDQEVRDLIDDAEDFVEDWNDDATEAGNNDCIDCEGAGQDDGTTPVYGDTGGGGDDDPPPPPEGQAQFDPFSCPGGTCNTATCGGGCTSCGGTPIGGTSNPTGYENSYDSMNSGAVNLESYRTQGKIVILDFFATWCGPCWSYAQSGILHDIQTNYGSQVQVVAFEGDPSTPDSAIVGVGNTQGNYTITANYPIVNLVNQDLLAAFGVQAFPTIIALYPDGTTLNVGQPSYSALESLITSGTTPGNVPQTSTCGQFGGCNTCGESLSGCGSCGGEGCGGGNCRPLKGDPFSLKKTEGIATKRDTSINQPMLAFKSPTPTEIKQGGLTFEPIYDETGCRIIGVKPLRYAEGLCAYWESIETYPETLNCNDEFVYGTLAGQRIRHHKMPNTTLEPHFVSFQTGVTTNTSPENYETNDGFVHLLGMKFWDVPMPPTTPKPLCPSQPFKIVYVKRDKSNKSITAKGLFIDTFKTEVYGEEYSVPKNGVNSLEFFDRYTKYNGDLTKERAGVKNDASAYIFHSPDTNFSKPLLNVQEANIELEIFGKGWRHGLYENGLETNSWWVPVTHQRGARQSIHLNKFVPPAEVTVINDPNGDPDPDPIICPVITLAVTQNSCSVEPNNITIVNGAYSITGIDPAEILEFKLSMSAPGVPTAEITTVILNAVIGVDIQGIEGLLVQGVYILYIRTATCTFNGQVAVQTLAGGTQGECINFDTTPIQGVPNDTEEGGSGNVNVITTEGAMTRCIKASAYAPADRVVNKDNIFTHGLLNLYRESSVYVEFDDTKLTLRNNIDRFLTDDLYNGRLNAPDEELLNDATCDGSFFGDVFTHEYPIYLASGWYGSLRSDRPSQYGRLESLIYSDLGIIADANAALCGRVEGIAGDTFISPYSVKRTAYISDHVGNNLKRPVELESGWGAGGSAQGGGKGGKLIKWFRQIIANFLGLNDAYGLETCGIPPVSRDLFDDKNDAGLRTRDGFVNRFSWDGLQLFRGKAFPGASGRRVYYPAVLNTLVTFWCESEVDVPLRQSGPEKNELAYPELKSLVKDSTLRRNSGWEIGWLNRFYVELKEVVPWKKYAVVAAHIFAKILFPIWIFSVLFRIGGSSIVGVVIAVLFAVIAIILVIVIIIVFTKYIDRILGIRQCRTDNDADRFADGSLRGFEDNFHRYNYDYSRVNDFQVYVGVSDPYYTCICPEKASNIIVYSDKQNITSQINAYRNFRVNNMLDFPADSGPIVDMFLMGRGIFAHTTDGIWNMYAGDREMVVDGENVYLGTGNFLNKPTRLYAGVLEGVAGNTDPRAAVQTMLGRLFVDQEARKLYTFNEGGLTPLSDLGLRLFFKNEMDFKIIQQFPDFKFRDNKHPYGVGYSIGYDPELDRVLFTKRDYSAKNPDFLTLVDGSFFITKGGHKVAVTNKEFFNDESFTLSYDIRTQNWVSFHDYMPLQYIWDRKQMFSFDGGKFWIHNADDNYLNIYGEDKPWIVEAVLRDDDLEAFEVENIEFDIDYISNHNGTLVYDQHGKFNNVRVHNSYQSTDDMEVKVRGRGQKEPDTSANEIVIVTGTNKRQAMTKIQDAVIDYTQAFTETVSPARQELIRNNIGQKKNETFLDTFLSVRLIFGNLQRVRPFIKRIISKVSKPKL